MFTSSVAFPARLKVRCLSAFATTSRRSRVTMTTSPELVTKNQWRRRMKQTLRSLSEDHVQAHQVVSLLQDLPEYKRASTISIYMSMPGKEVQTQSLVRDALDSQKQVFVPYIHKLEVHQGTPVEAMDMLQLEDREDLASLQPDAWGIPSLQRDDVHRRMNCFGKSGLTHGSTDVSITQKLDLVIVPAVAFDRRLNRLGHGKGYYDRFFTQYKQIVSSDVSPYRRPTLVGIALEEQMLPEGSELPIDDWDHALDVVITSREIIRPP